MKQALYLILGLTLLLGGCTPSSCSRLKLFGRNTSQEGFKAFNTIDVEKGSGDAAESGKKVSIHYRGWLYDASAPDNKGKAFDNSYDRDHTLDFVAGGGMVLKAWSEGVVGMKVGGVRRLEVPPSYGYGEKGALPLVPEQTSLVYEIKLMGVESPEQTAPPKAAASTATAPAAAAPAAQPAAPTASAKAPAARPTRHGAKKH
jgi:hypothetical protein